MQTGGGATALMYACQQCREFEVLDLIKKQPHSVKERDRTSKTPLHYCAENANTSCAEAILRAAPELVNAQDENGYCTLHLAVIAGNKVLIKLLITKGADVNVHDNEGHSAVHWAIVSSEKEALEMVIRAGANPSTPDIRGGYPLHYAVQMCGSSCDYVRSWEESIRVVETLLNFGVEVNVKDKDSREPILWAASAGSAEAVILLVSGGACVEAADKDGLTAVHCAASRGHTATLETLISLCGANVDVIDGNGCSGLFYAVTLGHADASELLLRLGAEPNRQDRKGRTPAHCGAAKGQLETLRILLKHGGNLWLRNVKGDIPLHEAVASGRKDLVLWLLSQNPEAINIANNDGRCPLHIASMYNNTEMVKVLLDAKSLVNPVMRTSKGVLMTPLNVALSKGHRSCGKYLQLHGGVPFSKVARLEPASVFAVRVSPSDESLAKKTAGSGREAPSVSHTKASQIRTPADVHTTQKSEKSECCERKKVFRRRKKRRSASNVASHSQDSDSDESVQDAKVKAPGKVSGSGGEDEREEEAKAMKVQLKTESMKQEEDSNEFLETNSKAESTAGDEGTAEEKVKKVTKTRSLLSSKSFNETKNVSDLSPEDFPPLMETVDQLDAVMMEADVEESKVEGDGKWLRAQEGGGVTREAEGKGEGNERDAEVDGVAVVEKEENASTGVEVKEEEIKKEVVRSRQESVKAVDETKSAEAGSAEPSPAGKAAKSLNASSYSDSDKREERVSRNVGASPTGARGSRNHKKTVRTRSPKETDPEQTTGVKGKDIQIEKAFDSEEKPREDASGTKQSEAESGGSDPDGDAALTAKTQTEAEGVFQETNKPESVPDSYPSEESEERELSHMNANDAVEEETFKATVTEAPAEERELFAGNESSHVTLTETVEEENLSSLKETSAEVSQVKETSTGAPELSSDCNTTRNAAEELPSENLPTESLPLEHPSEHSHFHQQLPERSQEPEEASQQGPGAAHQEELDRSRAPDEGQRESNEGDDPAVDDEEELLTPEDFVSKEEGDGNGEENCLHGNCSGGKNLVEFRPPRGPRVSRLCRRQRNFKGDVNDASVTQLVQNTLRKYHMERGIFYQLLELKRYQIRSGRANEQVLVKRLADEYERSRIFLGMKPYSGLYKFREFEKFLYDQLKALNARRSFLIPEIKSYDDIDALSAFLKKSRYKIINDVPQPEMGCTCITQRCHHSADAYTSVPCSAYITDLRRHRRHKPKREGLFPRIDQAPSPSSEPGKFPARPATLELIQGSEKHVITLPQRSPAQGKRYYVTFTIKGAPAFEEDSASDDPKNFLKHRHARTV